MSSEKKKKIRELLIKKRKFYVGKFVLTVLAFGLAYPILLGLPFYSYTQLNAKFDSFRVAIDKEDYSLARSLIPDIISLYMNFYIVLYVANIALLILIAAMFYFLAKILHWYGWSKFAKNTKIIAIILLLGILVSTTYVMVYAYFSRGELREILLGVTEGGELRELSNLDFVLSVWVLSYFLVGVALFYIFWSMSRLASHREELSSLSKPLRWLMLAAFLYVLEAYVFIKITWIIFPILSVLLWRKWQRSLS